MGEVCEVFYRCNAFGYKKGVTKTKMDLDFQTNTSDFCLFTSDSASLCI